MFRKITFGVVLLVITAMSAVGCAGSATPSSSVTIATTVPAASTVASAPGETTAVLPVTATAGDANSLPTSLKDVPNGATYTFRVDPTKTTVEYAVDEVLFGNKQITRGSTNDLDGEFVLTVKDGVPTFTLSKLTVNLQSLQSDNSMRDQMIQRQWLESAKYPTSTFVATSVQNIPSDAQAGKAYTFKVTGDMTIRNITKPVTFDVTVTLNGNTLTGEGKTQIYMKDYGFDPPEILGRFTVSDPATITIQGTANLVEG